MGTLALLRDGAAGDPAAADTVLALWMSLLAAAGWATVSAWAYARSGLWPSFGDLRPGVLALMPWALAFGWAARARRVRRAAGAPSPAVDLAARAVSVNCAAALPVAVASVDALAKAAI